MKKDKKQLWIVGLPDGNTTLTMCAYADKMGYECHAVLPENLEACFHELSLHRTALPMAVEPAYTPEQLSCISRAVLVGGLRIVPVGLAADWEAVIPLEMPELYALTVLPVESAWYAGAGGTIPITQAADNTPFCMVNGTLVCRETPKLAEPMADLTQAHAMPLPVAAVSVHKKKADTTFYLLISLLGVVVLTLVGALCILLSDNPESEYEDRAYSESMRAVQEEALPQAAGKDETTEPEASTAEPTAGADNSALAEHQNKVCPHIERKNARPGNEAYLQLEEGKKLGCPQCEESLNSPLVQHICPTAGADDYVPKLEQGKKIGCEACSSALDAYNKALSLKKETEHTPATDNKKSTPKKAVRKNTGGSKKRKKSVESKQPETAPQPVAPPKQKPEKETPSLNHMHIYGI